MRRESQPGTGSKCGEEQNLSFLQLPRLSYETYPNRANDVLYTVEFTKERVFIFVSKEKLKSKHVCYWSVVRTSLEQNRLL